MNTQLRAVQGPTDTVEQPLMPYQAPLRTWAGHGTGAVCNGCGCSIQTHEIEYEVELPPGNGGPALHFHFVCYRNWTGRGIR
jgi:hypothetical protein